MPGALYTQLFEVAASQYGYVTADDAHALDVPVKRLNTMAARGTLDRVSRGVYRFTAFPVSALDQYMEATLWPHGGGALSHATALDLHELCDVNPAQIHVTVGPGFRTNRTTPPVLRLHRRALQERDMTLHDGIHIVTPRRAILDGIEQHLGDELIAQAIANARERGLIRRPDLAEIAAARQQRELNQTRSPRTGPPVPVFRRGTGPQSGIDLTSKRALLEALDEGVELDDRR